MKEKYVTVETPSTKVTVDFLSFHMGKIFVEGASVEIELVFDVDGEVSIHAICKDAADGRILFEVQEELVSLKIEEEEEYPPEE